MNELQKLIEKWDEQIALHLRVCEDSLMYTKEDRLKNSHYAQAICAVVADLKQVKNNIVLADVSNRNLAYKVMLRRCGAINNADGTYTVQEAELKAWFENGDHLKQYTDYDLW